MATFKLAKKDAVSDTRTNIYDLHEKKIEYFESEKNKLDVIQVATAINNLEEVMKPAAPKVRRKGPVKKY